MRTKGAARRRQASTSPSHERWLLSYADFVTLLLAVFIVLFATTWRNKQNLKTISNGIHSGFESLSVGTSPTFAAPPAPPPYTKKPTPPSTHHATFNVAELNTQLNSVLGDEIKKREIVMQRTPDGLIISLRELGFFNSGEATLLPGAAEKLRRTARVLLSHGLEVRVEGHSDDQPIHTAAFRSNWELSTARAMSVLQLLLEDAGFPPDQISVAGYGPYRPVADNSTAQGRRSNRRVDLVIVAPRSQEETLHQNP